VIDALGGPSRLAFVGKIAAGEFANLYEHKTTGGPAKSGAVSVQAIEGVAKNQKSECARSYTRVGRDFLACVQGLRKILKSSG
jgi:hypothetical protein